MSKILITGASGFVGSWLVKEALNRGLDTFAGIRSTSSKKFLQDDRIKFVNLDFTDHDALRQMLKENSFDMIIHNAGVTRTHQDSIYFKVNSEYTIDFAKIALDTLRDNLKKFLFISSIEAYGSADDTAEGVVSNDIKPSPRTTYGLSKLRAEKGLFDIAGLPLLILRPTAVFGPGEKDLFEFWQTVKRFRITPSVGDAEIKYSFVYVKDLVRVVVDAVTSDITGKSYFVSDGRIHKMKDFLGHIADSLSLKTFGFTIPFFVLDAAVVVTGLIDKVTGKKSLLNPEQMAKAKARNWDCDIADLVKDFDYQAEFSLQDAIHETTQWYKSNNWL